MPPLIDLTGQVFGRLTVRNRSGVNAHGKPLWACDCSCGNRGILILARLLRSGQTQSCGCLRDELSAQKMIAIREIRPSTEASIPRDKPHTCAFCGLKFQGRHNAKYHPECYRKSRSIKRHELRAGKPEIEAAKLAAELKKRLSNG